MADPVHQALKYLAVFLVAGFVVFSLYDGLIRGRDDYTLAMGAAHRSFEDGRYQAALDAFNSALKLRPGDPSATFGLAISHLQLEHFDQSMASFDLAIAAESDDRNRAFYIANRGILHDRLGRYQDALNDYRLALQLAPETADGPGMIDRLLHNQAEKPPTIADRARYLQVELGKPEGERLLSVPAVDERQRAEKTR